jgi:hypothetical protein
MALAYNVVGRGSIGDLFVRVVDITLDAAYAAGGYTLSTLSAGFGTNGTVLAIIPCGVLPGFLPEFVPATGKLRIRDASGGVGAATPEVANNLAGLNGLVLRAVVLGRGQG